MSDLNSSAARNQSDPSAWEKDLLHKVVMESVTEQRRSRRWGIVFKSLTFAYLFLILGLFLWSDKLAVTDPSIKEHTAVIDVKGLISSDTAASADKVITGLRNAFEDKKTKGVILRLNTPGGSAVQSRYIYREIKRLREENPDIPVYAVCVDMCASGGYYIAAAADRIYSDEGSIVGSIGVVIRSFGFVDAMQKLGVDRRMITAGQHKGLLDPFSPLNPDDKVHLDKMLAEVHEGFINAVKEGRGDRLDYTAHPEIFSGLYWGGETAKKLGLVDEFGSSSSVAREVIGVKDIVDFTVKEKFWDRFAQRLGAGAASVFARVSGVGDGLQIQ